MCDDIKYNTKHTFPSANFRTDFQYAWNASDLTKIIMNGGSENVKEFNLLPLSPLNPFKI